MFCTQCGNELGDKDRFCPQCARPTRQAGPHPSTPLRLTRDMGNKKIAGVCAGLARYLDVDVVLIRVIWLALAICTGVGFIAYVIAWIVIPKEYAPLPATAPNYAHQS